MNNMTPMDDREIEDALVICYQLVSTVMSVSFKRDMLNAWVSDHDTFIVDSIQKKQTESLNRKLKFNFVGEENNILRYLAQLEMKNGVKIRAAAKKKLCRKLDLNKYLMLRNFIYGVSAGSESTGDMARAMFDFHESIGEVMDYLLMRDTIENGSGHVGLDKMIKNIIETKPVSFFLSGYLCDLFVTDRVMIHNTDNKTLYIGCFEDRLSTRQFRDMGHAKGEDEGYVLYKVA